MPRKSHNENDLCKWVSSKLTGVTVKGYPESFADGVIFCRLVETLTNQSIKDAIPNPKAYDDKLVNMGLAVAFLEAALRAHLEKVRPSLLAAGDASEVGSFLSFIILEFDSAAPICAGLETKVKKKNVSGTALEYTLPARLPGKGPKIFDTEDEKKKKKPRRSYFRWPAENTTERISTNTLPLITLRKNIYSKFQYDVEVNEAPTMEDIDKVITEETRFININASIHQQEIEHKIATKMTIKELQTIGKVNNNNKHIIYIYY